MYSLIECTVHQEVKDVFFNASREERGGRDEDFIIHSILIWNERYVKKQVLITTAMCNINMGENPKHQTCIKQEVKACYMHKRKTNAPPRKKFYIICKGSKMQEILFLGGSDSWFLLYRSICTVYPLHTNLWNP